MSSIECIGGPKPWASVRFRAIKPGVEALRVEKSTLLSGTILALLNSIVPPLLFGILSLVEPTDLDIADYGAEQ